MSRYIRNFGFLGLVVLLIVAPGVWVYFLQSPDSGAPEDSATIPAPQVAPALPPAATPQQAGDVTGPDEMAPEFRADIDGHVTLDDSGHLVPDINLRQLFDDFIGTAGDPPDPDAVRQALAAYLQDKDHSVERITEILALFDRYTKYLAAAAEVDVPSQDADTLESVLEELYRLRRQILGPAVAEAFFAEEEAYDRYSIERRRILEAEHHDETTRRQLLEMLDQQLPDGIAATRERTLQLQRLGDIQSQLREEGASPEEIDQARRELLGDEAAERLSQLDAQRAEWDRRVREFHQQREALLQQPGLSDNDREAAVEQLIEDNFSDHEARRLRALERLQESQQ